MEYRLINPLDSYLMISKDKGDLKFFDDSVPYPDKFTYAYPEGVVNIGGPIFSLAGIVYIDTPYILATDEALKHFKKSGDIK